MFCSSGIGTGTSELSKLSRQRGPETKFISFTFTSIKSFLGAFLPHKDWNFHRNGPDFGERVSSVSLGGNKLER